MSKFYLKMLLVVAVLLPAHVTVAGDKVVVIVNEANKDVLSKQKVKDIYNDRIITWSNGRQIDLLNLPVDDAARARFSQEVLRITAEEASQQESERNMTNTARNPSKTMAERLIVSIVAKSRDAIGYVSESALSGREGIRRVFELGGLPQPEGIEKPLAAVGQIPLLQPAQVAASAVLDDGIHDPANEDIGKLSDPVKGLAVLPHNKQLGVDWAMALQFGMVKLKGSLDGKGKANVIDMNIVMTKTGSKPAVTFSHKTHTNWLDCRACHPVLFEPLAKGNPITMDKINKGEYCGLCHGTVAQPLNTACDSCHIPENK